jgi:transcriptional regulator of acetoin/glycerol metabolism
MPRRYTAKRSIDRGAPEPVGSARVRIETRDRATLRRRLDEAWDRFLRDGDLAGVRPEIARSWQRARDLYAIDPRLARAPLGPADELASRRERDETLALASPLLARFSAQLQDSGQAVAWFGADGVLLSIGGDPRTVARLADINLCPGASWREESAGTNATGTAIADARPVEVFASEHFVEAWRPWSSVAAPVILPGAGALVGVVQITGPWDAPEPQGLVAVSALASAIEERLRARQEVRDAIFRYAARAARTSAEAVVAVDANGRVLQANELARRRLAFEGGELPSALRERVAATLRSREAERDDEPSLEWPGAERRRVTVAVVAHEGRTVGALLRCPTQPPTRPARAARPSASARYAFEAILGRSPRLRAALDLAATAARNDLPVVLHGESGTGKELFAHGVHAASARASGPLIVLNCGAIPASLIEAELFGYEPGTFTGAQREGKAGKFEEADGGTLFLDEVSELPPQAQTALLRVLQEAEVIRLGGSTRRTVDVRVVAATNRRLYDEVEAGRFRQDLFFRLNVLHVDIPPLRDRKEDVPLLAEAFRREAEGRIGREGLVFSEAAMERLIAHAWPGNVRELRNVVTRAVAVVAADRIEPADLRLVHVRAGPAGRPLPPAPTPEARAVAEADGPERDELVAALDASDWNIARTAASLGVSRMTLYRRLRKFGITR